MSSQTFDNPKSLEARQSLLDNRCEHKPKNHRTLKRRKALSKAKRQKIKHIAAVKLAAYRAHKAKVREYWASGEVDHPE